MSKPILDARRQATIYKLLQDRYGAMLRDERFEIAARVEGDNPVMQVVLRSNDRTLVYTMEAALIRADYPAMTLSDALDVCVDFLDWYLGEYFREERDAFLPLDWKKYRFGDLEVMARGDLRNALLDDLADAWLRGETDVVVREVESLKRRRPGH
jgi:hypothetical protein